MNIGIIGGTGISQINIFNSERHIELQTPFGDPSGKIAVGKLGNSRLFFLPRHGWNHNIPPSTINYRANIWALKALGCTHIIGTTATCSLKEKVKPGDLMMLSSYINRTTQRERSFYNRDVGIGCIPMQSSFNQRMNKLFYYAAQLDNYTCHQNGLVVVVDGPRYPTIADSALYHSWGADVISMTTVPEVCLAKELSLLYSCIASVTDYCNWNSERKSLKVEDIVRNFQENGNKVANLIRNTLPWIETESWDEEIKLLERSIYKKGFSIWTGPSFPPWFADRKTSKKDLILAAQKPLNSDINGAFANESHLEKSVFQHSANKSKSLLPIISELCENTDAENSSPLIYTPEYTSMKNQIPTMNEVLHSTESKTSNLTKSSKYPSSINLKRSPFFNNSKIIIPDTFNTILSSRLPPVKPLPKEINIEIVPIPYAVRSPGILCPPPQYKLERKISFIVHEQTVPKEFPVVINVHPPPKILDPPTHKIHLAKPFILCDEITTNTTENAINLHKPESHKRIKTPQSKHPNSTPK